MINPTVGQEKRQRDSQFLSAHNITIHDFTLHRLLGEQVAIALHQFPDRRYAGVWKSIIDDKPVQISTGLLQGASLQNIKMKRIRNDRNHAAAKYTCFVLLFFSFITISPNINAQANKWIAPKEADDLKNPLADKTDVLPNAKVMYTTYCTPCHGNKGNKALFTETQRCALVNYIRTLAKTPKK